MDRKLRQCRRMSRPVPPHRGGARSFLFYLSAGRTQSSFPCSRGRSPILPSRSFQVCAFSFCVVLTNLLGCDHHLDCFPVVHRPVTVRNPVETDGTIENATRLDLALKNVWQKLLDISPHWCNPAAHHDIVVKCWLGSWNRLLLRNAYAPHRATRTSDANCGIHRLLKADAFQH